MVNASLVDTFTMFNHPLYVGFTENFNWKGQINRMKQEHFAAQFENCELPANTAYSGRAEWFGRNARRKTSRGGKGNNRSTPCFFVQGGTKKRIRIAKAIRSRPLVLCHVFAFATSELADLYPVLSKDKRRFRVRTCGKCKKVWKHCGECFAALSKLQKDWFHSE